MHKSSLKIRLGWKMLGSPRGPATNLKWFWDLSFVFLNLYLTENQCFKWPTWIKSFSWKLCHLYSVAFCTPWDNVFIPSRVCIAHVENLDLTLAISSRRASWLPTLPAPAPGHCPHLECPHVPLCLFWLHLPLQMFIKPHILSSVFLSPSLSFRRNKLQWKEPGRSRFKF